MDVQRFGGSPAVAAALAESPDDEVPLLRLEVERPAVRRCAIADLGRDVEG
jgi:hypothetical protein